MSNRGAGVQASSELAALAEELSLGELDQLVDQVLRIRARRLAPSLPEEQAELLRRINEGVPVSIGERYDQLIRLRDNDKLAAHEYEELLHLTEVVEERQANRLADLIELARLRGVSLDQLTCELGIGPGVCA